MLITMCQNSFFLSSIRGGGFCLCSARIHSGELLLIRQDGKHLQSAETDFVCVAPEFILANSFFLQSAEADFVCVAPEFILANWLANWLAGKPLLLI